ncbi:MAG TPA: translation elongation factor Ts [Phycisphaerae bacterium]|nr:translation elongation factor Ts [Phycisphaerae bacterium]
MAVTAAVVKELRESTGLGMMDCKKALDETNGDIQAAKDLLRKKGLATAEKKAGRATKEGLICMNFAADGTSATMIEVQCETDFCARNEEFVKMVNDLAEMAASASAGKIEASDKMTARLQETLAKIGENMNFARGIKITAPKTTSYLHHNKKVGVIVGYDGELDAETAAGLCQHIAFANPMGLVAEDIPAAVIEKEREFARQEAIDSGKPAEIAEKMVEGKIRKFVAERVLLEQNYVKDEKKKIKDILGKAKVVAFARFAVGDM